MNKDDEFSQYMPNPEKMVQSLGGIFPLWCWVNLSRNLVKVLAAQMWKNGNYEPSGGYDELFDKICEHELAGIDEFRRIFSREALIEVFDNGSKSVGLNHQMYFGDGMVHWVETNALLMPIEGGDVGMVCVSRIIDSEIKQKKKNAAMQRMIDKYRAAVLESSVGIFEVNLTKDKLISNVLGSAIMQNDDGEGIYEYRNESYTYFINQVAKSIMISATDEFLAQSAPERLIAQYREGHKSVDVISTAMIPNYGFMVIRSTHYLSEDVKTGDIEDFCIINDITDIANRERESKQYAELVCELSESYESIYYVDIITDKYSEFNPKGGARKINLELSGKNFFDEIQNNLKNVVYEEDQEILSNFLRKEVMLLALVTNENVSKEYRVMVNGNPTYYRMKLFLCSGSRDKVILAIENVDEAVRTEKEKSRRFNEALREAKKRAEAANEVKTAFLASMSHDIRTPLNTIMGFNNIALEHMDDSETLENALRKTGQACKYLLAFSNDILDVVQIETGDMLLNPSIVDIHESCREFNTMLEFIGEGKNRKLEFKVGNIYDNVVNIDRERYKQIIMNIISNAFKFTEDGDTISVLFEQIEPANDGIAMYKLIVRDTGIGMSPEFIGHIGERFVTETPTTVRQTRGMGVGLSIVKHIIQLMNGRLSVTSEEGKGSEFTVITPFEVIEEHKKEKKLLPTTSRIAGKKILVVDDNILNQRVIVGILKRYEVITDVVGNGQLAVDAIKEKGIKYYDAILMDIMMPVMDGYEATAYLRNRYQDSHIPIIGVSANFFESDKAKSREIGMDEHLPKPVIASDLIAALERTM